MKRLIILLLLIPSLLFAGSLQQKHKSVIARMDVEDATGSTVTYKNEANANATDGDGVTVTVPANTSDGDMLIITWFDDFLVAPDTLTGWTALANSTEANSTMGHYYRVASSDASQTYTITTSTNESGRSQAINLTVYAKTSGTWNVATYDTGTEASSASITTGALTTTDGSVLHCAFGNDGGYDVDTAPSSMTLINANQPSSLELVDYYQEYTTGSAGVTKTCTFVGADQLHSFALVVKAL